MHNYNEYRISQTKPKDLTLKQLREIDRRRLYAMKCNDLAEVEDLKEKVLNIIDNKGLDSKEDKISLDTALNVSKYMFPVKKQVEMQVITRRIEDLIHEDIEEVEIIDDNEKTEQK